MTKLNPKQHALMRYLSRIHNEVIITDNAFRDWRERHPEEVKEATKKIIEISGDCEIILVGKYNKENQEREYRISRKEQLILVCDRDNILTVYPIEFGEGLSEGSNLAILNVLHEDYLKLTEQKKRIEDNHKDTLVIVDENISRIEDAIKSKKMEIQKLELGKTECENIKKQIRLEEEQLNLKIKDIAKKIVNPAFAFRE